MKNHGIVAAIIIFACIIAGMFVFAFLKKSELKEVPIVQTPPVVTTPYDNITRIEAKHYFIDGTHTIAGEMLMPTACDLINWEPIIRESMPEQVTISFTVINNAESCAQVITPARFLVPFTASADAQIDATLNGRVVELNLIPATEGEKPEDFELYIKG
jgi:hypothetical protein